MRKIVCLLIILFGFSSCVTGQRGEVKPDARYGWNFIICPTGTLIGKYKIKKPGLHLSEELFKQMRKEDEAEKAKLKAEIKKLKKKNLLWVNGNKQKRR